MEGSLGITHLVAWRQGVYTPVLEMVSTSWGDSDGEEAMIQNRKVVFVLIAVMTHSRVLHLCGKQAQLVESSCVLLVQTVCVVLLGALFPNARVQSVIIQSKSPNVTAKPNKSNQA